MQTRRSFLRTSLAATTAIFADVSSIVATESPTMSKSPSNPSIDGIKFFSRRRLITQLPGRFTTMQKDLDFAGIF
jgi:hypothetical protein